MVLDPLISKSQAIVFGNKLIRWINVCERERVRFLARFLLRMRRYLPEAAAVIYALFFYVLLSQKEEERLIMTNSYTF